MRASARGLAFVLSLLLPATLGAQSRNIHETSDPYSGLRTLTLEVSTRSCPEDPSLGPHDPDVHVLFSATETREGTVWLLMTPVLDHGDSLSLRKQGTMNTLVHNDTGDHVRELRTVLGSTVTTAYSMDHGYIHETVPFPVTKEFLSQLAGAQTFQFRLNGPRQFVERCTDARHLRDLAEFVSASSEYAATPSPEPVGEPLHENVDPESGVHTLTLSGIVPHSCGLATPLNRPESMRLSIAANQRRDGTVRYYVVATMDGEKPLHLPSKGLLDVRVDQTLLQYAAPHGSQIETVATAAGPVQRETIAFHVDRRDLVAMEKARQVRFHIGAQDKSAEGCTDPDQLSGVNAFLEASANYKFAATASAPQQ